MEKHFWSFVAGVVLATACLAIADKVFDVHDQFVRGMFFAFGWTFAYCYVCFKAWKS